MTEKEEILDEVKSDKALEDFNCSYSLSQENSLKGQLCYTKNYIRFKSEGEEKPISLDYKEINKILLNNNDNIEIETKNEKKFNFFSFEDTNSVFDKINLVYKIYIENENREEEKNSISNSDSDNDVYENNKTIPSSKYSLNSSTSNDAISKEDGDFKVLKETQSSSDIKKLHLNNESDEKMDIIRNNSSNDLKVSKKLELLDIKEKEEEKPIIPEKLEFIPIDTSIDNLVCTKIINLPPKDLFEKYQTNKNKETSYHAYYEYVGEYSEIEVSEWEPLEKKENEIQKYQRKEKFCISLHGVPLINKSHVEKTCEYWIDEKGTYFFHSVSVSTGVPLSDKFTIETTAEFHPYMNNTKTVFRTYVRTNILKWTMFKMALIYQGKRTYTQEMEKWLKFMTEKGDKIEGDY